MARNFLHKKFIDDGGLAKARADKAAGAGISAAAGCSYAEQAHLLCAAPVGLAIWPSSAVFSRTIGLGSLFNGHFIVLWSYTLAGLNKAVPGI